MQTQSVDTVTRCGRRRFMGDRVRVVIFIVVGVLLCGAFVSVGVLAFGAGVRSAAKDALRKFGLTREHVKLYHRAGKLLNRLAAVTDLDGAYAGDNLSPETKKLVTDWVDDYKREINQA